MEIANERSFIYNGRAMRIGDLSTCMSRLVLLMQERVQALIADGKKVGAAIEEGVSAVAREQNSYSPASRDEAAEIVLDLLADSRARRKLERAHKLLTPRAPNTHKHVGHRHLMPVPMR